MGKKASRSPVKTLLLLCMPLLVAVTGAMYAVFGLDLSDTATEPDPPSDNGRVEVAATGDGDTGTTASDQPEIPADRPPPPKADPATAASVRGVVRLYRSKERVSGLVLELRPAIEGASPYTAKTNKDGTFRFPAVVPGAGYELHGSLDPYAPIAITGIDLEPKARHDVGTLWLEVPVDMPVEVISLTGAPLPGATVSVFATTRQSLPPSSGWGAERDARILSLTSDPNPTGTAVTGSDGQGVVKGLLPGTYRVSAKAEGWSQQSRAGIVLAPDAAANVVRLVLGPGHKLVGSVLDEHGKPVIAAQVIGVRGDSWNVGVDKWMAPSGEDGAYELAGLPAGRMTVYLAREGKPLLQMGSFGIPETERFDIRLRPGGTMRGTVTDEEGAPVKEAEIRTSIQAMWSPMSTKTDEEGKYVLEDVPAGPLAYFRVIAEGYMPFPDPSAPEQGSGESLREGAEMVRDVTLRRGLAADIQVKSQADGSVVPAARIQLYLSPPGGGGGQPWSATADEQGAARVTGLVPGNYLVVIQADGFVQEGLPRWYQQVLWSPEALPEQWRIMLEPGSGASATYELAPGAKVSGTVKDADGNPVAGARIAVEGARNEFPVFSDGSGAWTVEAVPASDRKVASASAPKQPSGRSEPFIVPAGGHVENIEIKLEAGAGIVGSVRSEDGQPLHGAMVRFLPGKLNEGNTWQFNRFDGAARWPVAQDGRFRITGVPVGSVQNVTVRADAEGYLPSWNNEVKVAANQETGGIDLILTKALAISGRVETEGGDPVAGATVSAQYRGSADKRAWDYVKGLGGDPTAQTNATGEFTLKGLKEGRYRLWSQAAGFAAGTRVETQTGAGDVIITLATGKSISGILKDQDGNPVAGLPVQAEKTDNTNSNNWWWWGNTQAYSGPDGTFELRDLADGVYTLVVSARWQWGREVNVEDTREQGVNAGRDDVSIIIASGRIIEGKVVDWDGKPIRTGWVSANYQAPQGQRNWGDNRWAQLRADGGFRLVGLKAGSYNVSVSGAFKPKTEQGVASGTKDLKIEVQPAFSIQGKVVDKEGLALATGFNMRVRQSGEENWRWTQTVTPGDGTFTIMGLDEGAWDLQLNAEGFPPAVVESVTAGARDVRIVMEAGVTMAGLVVSTGGTPLTGASVSAVQVNVPTGKVASNRYGRADKAGAFRIEGLSPGEYQVRVTMRNFAPMVIGPVAGNSQSLKLVMDRGTTITGKALDPDGNPMPGSRLTFADTAKLHSLRASTQQDGSFQLSNVPAGLKWSVTLRRWENGQWTEMKHEGEVDSDATDVELKLK